MTLGDKIRQLRAREGNNRGLNREMTQREVCDAIRNELGESLSQAYLSQLEKGTRPHLTNKSRLLLARFFKVHPGHLVNDLEGQDPVIPDDPADCVEKFDLWLVRGAERFQGDPELNEALLTVAHHPDSRRCLILLAQLLRAGLKANPQAAYYSKPADEIEQ